VSLKKKSEKKTLMKKYSINIDGSLYEISTSIADAFIRNDFGSQPCVKNGVTVFLLNNTDISFFQVAPTTSLTHFYILTLGKKHRINCTLYSCLLLSSSKGSYATTGRISTDKFYTKPDIAEECVSLFARTIKIYKNDLIIEPSAGNGVSSMH
jgi:hypothetical protein